MDESWMVPMSASVSDQGGAGAGQFGDSERLPCVLRVEVRM